MGLPQPNRDDREPQDVTDIDTARLALRGAVESLRSLQEVNQRLKGDMQEYSNRNKMLDQRLIELQTELNTNRARLDQQDQVFEKKEEALRRSIRQEVTIEENQRWQAEFASLRQSLEMWKLAQEQKEAELARLKEIILEREETVAALHKEKVVLQGKANQELANALAKSRTDLRLAVEAIIAEKDSQVEKVRGQLAEQILALEKDIRIKDEQARTQDETIAVRFHERQKELSDFWVKREQEIWARANEAKVALEAGLKERWEGRLKDLTNEYEQKTGQMKEHLAQQQMALQAKDLDLHTEIEQLEASLKETYTKKAEATELSFRERTSQLEMQWNVREKKLTDAHRKAIDAERARLQEDLRLNKEQTQSWQVTRDSDFHAKEAELRQRHQNLEKELRDMWGKREEELTLRHNADMKKTQDTIYQTMHDKLSVASADYAQQVELLQTQLASLDAKRQEQESDVRSLQTRVSGLEKEKTQLATTLEERETSLRKLLEQKEIQWTATNETLRKQALDFSRDASEKSEAQKLRITDLEKQNFDFDTQAKAQQDRIQGLEKERKTLAETLQEREAVLHSELDVKEREWAAANEVLRTQLSTLTTESLQRSETHKGRIAGLEKLCEEQATQFKSLQDTHTGLERDRAQLAHTFKVRESSLLAEMAAKQKEWRGVNETLQAQLTILSADSSKTTELQQARITELERQSMEAQSQVKILQQKLIGLEKERAVLSETLQSHETDFRAQISAREAEWSALNGTLRDQLAALTRETSEKIETLQELAAGLEKQKTELSAHAHSLESQVRALQNEHVQVSESLKSRISGLEKERDVKQAEWKAVQDALEEQLKKVTGESAKRNEVQMARIVDLETRNLEARSDAKVLQQKLEHLQAERVAFQLKVEAREVQLQKEFEDTRKDWMAAYETLQAQLKTQSQDAIQKQETYKAQFSDLERIHAEAKSHLQAAEQRLMGLEKERASLMETLQGREAAFQKQLQEHEHAWAVAKEALERQLATTKRDALKKEDDQQQQITNLEKQVVDTRTQWMGVRERLNNVEKQRQAGVDKLDTQEKVFRLELADKERAWTAAKDSLQEELTTQKATSAQERIAHDSRVAEFEKHAAEAQADIQSVKEKLQAVEKERTDLALALQNREHELLKQLTDQERATNLAREALEEKLATLGRESAQKQLAQQTLITDLETRRREAVAEIAALQEKLAQLTKERDVVGEKLNTREATLQRQLTETQQTAEKTQTALREQVAELKAASIKESATAQARIADLEKRSADSDKYVLALKDKLQNLDKERATISTTLQTRERDLHQQMEEKTRAWMSTKESLEEKLASLSRESAQVQKTQQSRIADLEGRLKEGTAQLNLLQGQLDQIGKERDTLSETLQARELVLQRDLDHAQSTASSDRQALEAQVAALSKDAQQRNTLQQARISDLEKLTVVSTAEVGTLKDKLASVVSERDALAESMRVREKALRNDLQDKKEIWERTERELQDKLALVSGEAVREREDQQARITDLARRQAEAQALIQTLQDKLQALEQERQALTDTLHSRETLLREDLERKQKESAATKAELKAQIEKITLETSRRNTVQNAQLEALEKRSSQAESQVQQLRDQLQLTSKDRQETAAMLEAREQAYGAELAAKEREWNAAKEAFEERLNGLSRDAAQKQKVQQAIISDLESRQKDAGDQVRLLQETLKQLGKERDSQVETLKSREVTVQRELELKVQGASALQKDLQEQLAALKLSSSAESITLKSRIADLEKRGMEADTTIQTLRDKLSGLTSDRASLSVAFQTREQALLKQLDEREREWSAVKASLEEKLLLSNQDSSQTQKAQQALITNLEARQKEATQSISLLQVKLQKIQEERDSLAETSQAREMTLRKDLGDKEKSWVSAKKDLEDQLTALKLTSSTEIIAQKARAADLEKRGADAESALQTLREKLQLLNKDRSTLALSFQNREQDLLKQLDDKEREWSRLKESLEEKISTLSQSSSQAQKTQQAMIADLEIRLQEATQSINLLQDRLRKLQDERDSLANTSRSDEMALRKELEDKEKAWALAKKDLDEQVAALKLASSTESAAQKLRIADLEKRSADAEGALLTLREKLQNLNKDRANLSLSIQNREQTLLKQLDDKEREWTRIKDALEDKLSVVTEESSQKQKAQQALIVDLEARQKEAAQQIALLQDALRKTEEERNSLTDTLRSREMALRKELDLKMQSSAAAEKAFQDALAEQKQAAFVDGASQRSRIADLEKRSLAAETLVQSLREKLQHLEQERGSLTLSLQNREQDLQQQLSQKEREWSEANTALEERLSVLARDASQKQKIQQATIADLESRQKDASDQIRALQESLKQLSKERDGVADTLQSREAGLRKNLEQKELAWSVLQKDLQEQLDAQKLASSTEIAGQKERIIDLEKRSAEAEAALLTLREKLQLLNKDRSNLSLSLQNREQSLLKQLEDKEREWSRIKEALEEKLFTVTEESGQRQKSQQALIIDLEARQKEAGQQIGQLQDALRNVEAERNSLADTLRTREMALRKELDQKVQFMTTAEKDLKDALAEQKQASSVESASQRLRISDLEKRSAAAENMVQSLREKLQHLDQERGSLALSLQNREQDLQQQLSQKEREWSSANSALEERLSALARDAGQKQKAQQLQISELEARERKASDQLATLQQTLASLEKDRDQRIDAYQAREAQLRRELTEKQRAAASVQTTLESELAALKETSAYQAKTQQALIKDLEKRQAQLASEADLLREKLHAAEADRKKHVDDAQAQVVSIRQDLDGKKQEWEAARQALEDRMINAKEEASRKAAAQQALLITFEKRAVEAESQVEALRGRLQNMGIERTSVEETLRTREASLRGELVEKERIWTGAREALEEKLESLQGEASRKTEKQKMEITLLEKQNAEAYAQVESLRNELHQVDKERARTSDDLDLKEKVYRTELADKEQAWLTARETLERQLATLKKDSQHKLSAEQARAADLESRMGMLQGEVDELRRKLNHVEKEREESTESWRLRESALRKDLETKARAAEHAQQALQDQLSEVTGQTAEEREAQQAKVAEMRRRQSEAEGLVQSMQAKLQDLEKERKRLSGSLESREGDVRRELEQKQRDWTSAREDFENQLSKLKKESARMREEHKAQQSEFEQKSARDSAQMHALKEHIQKLEKDRDNLMQDLRHRESDVEKRREALEHAIKQRESELEARTQKLEEDMRKAWAEKERILSHRIQAGMEKEQDQFWQRIKEIQSTSETQISKFQADSLRQEEDLMRRKKALDEKEAALSAQVEEARRELDDLQKEKAGWNERVGQFKTEESDVRKRQAELQSREVELEGLRNQLSTSLDTSGSGRASAGAVQTLIEEWVFGFAHQVRNPLGIIRSMTESMMQTRVTGKDKQESFGAILQAVDGLSRRLGEFIDFSKPLKASSRPTSLSEVANNALALVRDDATVHGIEIRPRFDLNLPSLSLDPEQLQNAIVHLLHNALEAMPKGGTLTIETKQESGNAVLRVHDSGSGISAAHMKEIGRPFFTTKPGHTGLGLAAAKRILHLFGSDLQFDSRPGHGTSVICRFSLKLRVK